MASQSASGNLWGGSGGLRGVLGSLRVDPGDPKEFQVPGDLRGVSEETVFGSMK